MRIEHNNREIKGTLGVGLVGGVHKGQTHSRGAGLTNATNSLYLEDSNGILKMRVDDFGTIHSHTGGTGANDNNYIGYDSSGNARTFIDASGRFFAVRASAGNFFQGGWAGANCGLGVAAATGDGSGSVLYTRLFLDNSGSTYTNSVDLRSYDDDYDGSVLEMRGGSVALGINQSETVSSRNISGIGPGMLVRNISNADTTLDVNTPLIILNNGGNAGVAGSTIPLYHLRNTDDGASNERTQHALSMRTNSNAFGASDDDLVWWTNRTNTPAELMSLNNVTGLLAIDALAGVGERAVVADANGNLKIGAGATTNTLYTADDTVGTNRIATLTDTLTFTDGEVIIKGVDSTAANKSLTLSNSNNEEWFQAFNSQNIRLDGSNTGSTYVLEHYDSAGQLRTGLHNSGFVLSRRGTDGFLFIAQASHFPGASSIFNVRVDDQGGVGTAQVDIGSEQNNLNGKIELDGYTAQFGGSLIKMTQGMIILSDTVANVAGGSAVTASGLGSIVRSFNNPATGLDSVGGPMLLLTTNETADTPGTGTRLYVMSHKEAGGNNDVPMHGLSLISNSNAIGGHDADLVWWASNTGGPLELMKLNNATGNFSVTNLSGVGDRNVVADANGVLKIGATTNTIYTADDTVGTGRVATLTDTLLFESPADEVLYLDGTNGSVAVGTTQNTSLQKFLVRGDANSNQNLIYTRRADAFPVHRMQVNVNQGGNLQLYDCTTNTIEHSIEANDYTYFSASGKLNTGVAIGATSTSGSTTRLYVRGISSTIGTANTLLHNSSGDTLFQVNDNGSIALSGDFKDSTGNVRTQVIGQGTTDATKALAVYDSVAALNDAPMFSVKDNGVIQIREFTVATLPTVTNDANHTGIICVIDEVGGRTLATSDGTNWRRISDGAVVA